jgi:3-hydroxyisobutyrate dehydrogenase-like beta-hydroxyacid dehydrogenase
MSQAAGRLALIGFGEAGMTFAEAFDRRLDVAAFDIKTLAADTAAAKREDYRRSGVVGAESLAEAVAERPLLVSVVTADQALAAAREAAPLLADGALYCDFNSVAPATKREAARIIESGGGRYVDVAVMAPVLPQRLAVPLLVSGPWTEAACAALAAAGFRPRRAGDEVGRASTIKMLRSVMVKGIEALTAECFLACRRAGVVDEVAASLAASWPGVDWVERADYNLDRMMVHGLRRAAEMDEVARTLADLGLANDMAVAAGATQRRIGELALDAPSGFERKASAILDRQEAA